jgi:hypothetical protein
MKENCWEHMMCGKRDECPAFAESKLHGVHGGYNSGRACWLIAGSMSGENPFCKFLEEIDSCRECAFYKYVKAQEGAHFQFSVTLLHLVHQE